MPRSMVEMSRTLIDRGATKYFVSRACMTMCGTQRRNPRDVFLELENGEKVSYPEEFISDVPIFIAVLTVKIGLTATNLLHEVDLVLGMSWLQLCESWWLTGAMGNFTTPTPSNLPDSRVSG